MSKRRANPGTLKFIVFAIALMVLVDMFLFRHNDLRTDGYDVGSVAVTQKAEMHVTPKLDIKMREDGLDYHYPSGRLREILHDHAEKDEAVVEENLDDMPVTDQDIQTEVTQDDTLPPVIMPIEREEYSGDTPLWLANSVSVAVPEGWRTVSIVIDDLGENRKYSREAIALQAPMTMALLPYSSGVDVLAQEAKEHGHETIIHMPMEPINSALDIGSIALKQSQDAVEFDGMLDRAFMAMAGYAGINNHMGSRLTQDKQAMARLMQRLKQEGLLFLDSKTIPQSIAAKTAKDYGVPYTYRDVFLDHDPSEQGVRDSIAVLERHIDKYGHAIAIGHPKEITLKVLREWVKTLDSKKIALVPVSYSVKKQIISDLKALDAPPQ